ncbi:unnamed protein product [Echinostoma caproni]|uniref:Centrosome and spindle pole associated protein 1 n=1 Tax=Echinostoma caproni TaxID=27848 RepID=A0A183ATL2_9TREM|nr:unnamed protein product [Echinostoma caproni]
MMLSATVGYPVSPNGVYRLCEQQQAELMEANHKFREKYMENGHVPLFSRLDLYCPPVYLPDRSSSSHSSPFSPCTEPLFPDPFAFQRPHRSESWQVADYQHHRYTMHDFSLLPPVLNGSRSLGPDLESDEYKAKLEKQKRQKRYGDRIREIAIRRRSSSNRTARLVPIYGEHNENFRDDTMADSNHDSMDQTNRMRSRPEKRRSEINIVKGPYEGEFVSATTLLSSPKPVKVKSEPHKLPELKQRINPEEDRRKAAEKREAKYDDQNSYTNGTDEEFYNTRVDQLLKRHEEDRKLAQSIQRTLKIEQ